MTEPDSASRNQFLNLPPVVWLARQPSQERGSDWNECEKLRFREQRRKRAREQRLQRIGRVASLSGPEWVTVFVDFEVALSDLFPPIPLQAGLGDSLGNPNKCSTLRLGKQLLRKGDSEMFDEDKGQLKRLLLPKRGFFCVAKRHGGCWVVDDSKTKACNWGDVKLLNYVMFNLYWHGPAMGCHHSLSLSIC